MDAGLLIAPVAFGRRLAVHGCQKLFGWFGGPSISGTAALLERIGFRLGRLFAVASALAECGGVLLALGLFEALAAAAIVSDMIVVIATVHCPNGLLALTNGIELPLLYLTAALALALIGAGEYSIDAMLGMSRWWTPQTTLILLAAGIVGEFGVWGYEGRRQLRCRRKCRSASNIAEFDDPSKCRALDALMYPVVGRVLAGSADRPVPGRTKCPTGDASTGNRQEET